MLIHKWLIMAGILGLSGCGGVAEAPPAPAAGGTPVAARSEASASPSPEPSGATPVAAKPGRNCSGSQAASGLDAVQFDGWRVLGAVAGDATGLVAAGKLLTVHIISCEHQGAAFHTDPLRPAPSSIVGGMALASMKRDRDKT